MALVLAFVHNIRHISSHDFIPEELLIQSLTGFSAFLRVVTVGSGARRLGCALFTAHTVESYPPSARLTLRNVTVRGLDRAGVVLLSCEDRLEKQDM